MATVNNEVITKALAQAKSVDEMLAAFADQGIELTAEELEQAAREALSGDSGEELSESDLEGVAGGSNYNWAVKKAGEIIKNVATEVGKAFVKAVKNFFGF
ncbi:MAG: Nif11-like leader peptide family RiPP precursor [Oscillospiraceae bacterium]|nr:Nif11-like leader peptide family RiPP precursor [Oscillospiraceae bacterium]